MALWKDIVFGRPNGYRQKVWKMFNGSKEDYSPSSSYSAPAANSDSQSTKYQSTKYQSSEYKSGSDSSKLEPPKDITPPDGFEVVLHKDALKPGEVTEVIIAGTAIALSNVDGKFYATSSTCPHADGPLAEGDLDGGILVCPYHGWGFDVKTGACQTNPDILLPTYEALLEGDGVCVRI